MKISWQLCLTHLGFHSKTVIMTLLLLYLLLPHTVRRFLFFVFDVISCVLICFPNSLAIVWPRKIKLTIYFDYINVVWVGFLCYFSVIS